MMNYNQFLFTMILKDTTYLRDYPYDELWDISRRLHSVYVSEFCSWLDGSKEKWPSGYVCVKEWISVNKQLINDITKD